MKMIRKNIYFALLLVCLCVAVYKNLEALAVVCLLALLLDPSRIQDFLNKILDKIQNSDEATLPGGFGWKNGGGSSPKEIPKAEERSGVPIDFINLFNQGHFYLQNGDYTKAENFFKKAYEIDPMDFNTCLALGLVCNLLKKNPQSIEYSQKALKINPDSFAAQFNLAVATNHLLGAEKSLVEYVKAKDLANRLGVHEGITLGKLNLFLGHDYRDLNKSEDALEHYAKAFGIFSEYNTDEAKHWMNDARREIAKLMANKMRA